MHHVVWVWSHGRGWSSVGGADLGSERCGGLAELVCDSCPGCREPTRVSVPLVEAGQSRPGHRLSHWGGGGSNDSKNCNL